MKVAVVHDWLDSWRGGENVLAEILGLFPNADLFALVDLLPEALRPRILGKVARTSWLQRLPWPRKYFRALLPFFPRAITSLDVSGYDIVISISHAVAKGVPTHRGQLHVCYCLTPMRYAWDLRASYLDAAGARHGVRRVLSDALLDRLQRWDVVSSKQVNRFAAISKYIGDRIARCYGRDASVIYPPVDTLFFTPGGLRGDYFLAASRWVPYKRIDLIVESFGRMLDRRLIVVGDGPEAPRVRAAGGPNVEFVGEVSRERLRELLRSARAFIFAAEEDFGILPVEAQACGTPVIAYRRGGVLETVRGLEAAQPTGVFFDEQSSAAIAAAVHQFDAWGASIDPVECRANAERFAATHFRAAFQTFVGNAWNEFVSAKG